MIVVVDDDEVMVELSQLSLEEAGFVVRGFTSPAVALAYLENVDPDLIVSDLMMPEMDGFAFRAAYLQSFPGRGTPFLFLSSVADPDVIAEGLDQGADDYLVKPVDHRVLAAKVRAVLRRRTVPGHVFHGDIAQFPLSKVMKFCELKGVTGTVDIAGNGVAFTIPCRGGNFELGRQGDTSQLEKAFELTSGSFTIRIQPVDYSEISHTQNGSDATAPAAQSQELPMGKLSGVKINQRMFQVQSEFIEQPHQQILTLVILDGKVVSKRGTPALLALGRETLQRMIEEQHVSVEQEINEKIATMVEARSNVEVTQKERFNSLFEDGWDCYRKGDYARALSLWEEAHDINPADKTIGTNLKIVRNKLAAA